MLPHSFILHYEQVLAHSLDDEFTLSIPEPFGMTLLGAAGAGKSFLIECLEQNLMGWSFLRPNAVLCASLKEEPTVAQIQADLLARFNYVIPPRITNRTNKKVFDLLKAAVKERGIKLIALDEYQHVFLSSKKDVRPAIIDWTKQLMTATQLPFLLSGTEMLRGIETGDPQLSTRVSSLYHLPEFQNDADWVGVLDAIVSRSAEIDLSLVSRKHTAVFRATKGVFRSLKGLLIEAAMVAVDAGEKSLKIEHLALAYQRYVGNASSKGSPFV
ncbi:AAA family ATPase [Paraburkholderia sp. FT54]|uniref:AAA family ATPase n=1 Tax=Paraburkholderia sp. FT54 TaxID=3074437 RepID=UPI0028775FB6|nr:AAA family ATPase [Paraburkholderia sp. FT54]WNC89122.1 AAA family ATPase [Paraburkholderia sp. FT54]